MSTYDENAELNTLIARYAEPTDAGERMALGNIRLTLWAEFALDADLNGSYPHIGRVHQPLYFSQRGVKAYKKYHAPMGVIVPEKSMLDFDPAKVAAHIVEPGDGSSSMTTKQVEGILNGLPRLIDWLVRVDAELRERIEHS